MDKRLIAGKTMVALLRTKHHTVETATREAAYAADELERVLAPKRVIYPPGHPLRILSLAR